MIHDSPYLRIDSAPPLLRSLSHPSKESLAVIPFFCDGRTDKLLPFFSPFGNKGERERRHATDRILSSRRNSKKKSAPPAAPRRSLLRSEFSG